MAPVNKITSASGFIYEKNNFVALTDTTGVPVEFHNLMQFVKTCKLSHAMLTAPSLRCEVIEAFWQSARYDADSKILSFSLNSIVHTVTCQDISDALKLPINNTESAPTTANIVDMLDSINYVGETSNLGKIVRSGMRR